MSVRETGLVSVIIPARNAQLTLNQTLKSVFAQTYRPIEVLLVDYGSTDATREIAARFTNAGLRILSTVAASAQPPVTSGPTSGHSAARNLGIKNCSGEYLAFIDTDDLWLPDKLSSQIVALADSPEHGACYSWVDRLDAAGTQTPHNRDCPWGDLLACLRHDHVVGGGSSLLLRADLLAITGDFCEELTTAEFWEFSARVAAHTRVLVIPRVLSLYRATPGLSTPGWDVLADDFVRAQAIVCGWSRDYSPEDRRAGRAAHFVHLSRTAQACGETAADNQWALRLLLRAWWAVMGNRSLQQRLGLHTAAVWRVARRIVRNETIWRRRGREYRTRGVVGETFTLADPSVLPVLRDEAALFDEALAQLADAGHHYRVPYMLTPGIERVSQDINVQRVIRRLLPADDKWVMWGANIRREIPNAAEFWHVDSESFRWGSVTVAVGLSGCDEHSVTHYLAGSHSPRAWPADDMAFSETARVTADAASKFAASVQFASFAGFANGRFYAFDAGGWHCGDPEAAQSRVLLFLDFHSARAARIPQMDNYRQGTWLPEAASYLAESGSIPNDTLAVPEISSPTG